PPRPLPPQSWQLRVVSELRPVCISPADRRTDPPARASAPRATHHRPRTTSRNAVNSAFASRSLSGPIASASSTRVSLSNPKSRSFFASQRRMFARVDSGWNWVPQARPTRKAWNSQASLEASSVASAGSSTIRSTWLSRNDVRSRIAANTGAAAATAGDRGERRGGGWLGGGAGIGVCLGGGPGPGPPITTDGLGDERPAEADPQLRQVRVEAVTDEFGLLGEPGSAIGLIGHVSAAERDKPGVALQRARCGQGRGAADAQLELVVIADPPLCMSTRIGVDGVA